VHCARAFGMVLAALACAGAAQAVPLEVYGRLPRLEDVSISPDGTKIAFVRTEGDTRIVALVSYADRHTLKAIRVGNTKLRSVRWADDFRVMITTSETALPWGLVGEESEWMQLVIVDYRESTLVQVPRLAEHGDVDLMNTVIGEPMVRRVGGHTVLFVPGIYVSQRTLPCLVRYDLDTGGQRVVRRGGANIDRWLVDSSGKVIAEQNYVQEDGRWRIRVVRDGSLADVASGRELIDAPSMLGYGPTGDTLLTQFTENGDPVWKLLSLKDGSFVPFLEGRFLRGPIEDPRTQQMIGGVQFVDNELHYVFFDRSRQKSWDAIVRAYGAADHARFVSASEDFRKIIVLVEGAKMGYQYQLVDLEAGRTASIGDVYEGIETALEVRPVVYPAADGLAIPGYLTLPPGREPVKLPLIVLPHGGPATMDTRDFDWWSQALADQGYAVLRPNYRGSTLDARFMARGYGEFGRKMQTDLSDGVRYLVREGIADPARVCIVGASYGGYAALAGVALDPGIYRCAVSVAGISDLGAFLRWVDRKHLSRANSEQRYLDRFLGVQNRKDPKLDEISPIKHLDAINVPVLLIHGKDDTVVPYDQSDDMYDALRAAHKQAEFVQLKGEDHWLSRSATRLQMLQAVVAFLRKNNPPE
jgi:pimeloyl-ACP methyl ester carboxylesterase